MKQFYLLAAALVSFSLTSNAMTSGESKSFPQDSKDYVITLTNDTIYGYIKKTNYLDNQTEVLFFTDSYKPAIKADKIYGPNGLKGFKVKDRIYEAMDVTVGKEPKKRVFLHRTVTGPISLYDYYSDESEAGKQRIKRNARLTDDKRDYNVNESTLQRNKFGLKNGVLTDLSEQKYILSYKKAMSEYISDYPELAKKIADKEKGYGFINMLKHIYEYNDWAKANK